MIRFSYFYLLLTILFTQACSGPRGLARPEEKYSDVIKDNRSILSIPIELSLFDLEGSLNRELSGVVYEDDSFSGDNMKVTAIKNQNIRIGVQGNQINYRIPLDLTIIYDAGITTATASGEISMEFKTDFEIASTWGMVTKTEIVNYEWLRKPRLKMGIVDLPMGTVANIILRNGKNYIAGNIDKAVRNGLKLEQIIADTWKQMYEPILVSPEYNTWLQVNPQDIGMSPIVVRNDTLYSQVIIESKPAVKVGGRPQGLQALPLPSFEPREETFEGFAISIGAQVSYEEAERIARQQLVGETFSYGKRQVKVNDIGLYGQEDKVIVSTALEGTYNGTIYLEGRPVYDLRKNAIEIKDLDYTLDTKSALYKSASWLLKGTIKNRIQDNINFLVDANLSESKEMMQKQLDNYPIAAGINLRGEVDELSIRDIYIVKDGLYADILLTGKMKITVDDIRR